MHTRSANHSYTPDFSPNPFTEARFPEEYLAEVKNDLIIPTVGDRYQANRHECARSLQLGLQSTLDSHERAENRIAYENNRIILSPCVEWTDSPFLQSVASTLTRPIFIGGSEAIESFILHVRSSLVHHPEWIMQFIDRIPTHIQTFSSLTNLITSDAFQRESYSLDVLQSFPEIESIEGKPMLHQGLRELTITLLQRYYTMKLLGTMLEDKLFFSNFHAHPLPKARFVLYYGHSNPWRLEEFHGQAFDWFIRSLIDRTYTVDEENYPLLIERVRENALDYDDEPGLLRLFKERAKPFDGN
jgi:hypothetical protein